MLRALGAVLLVAGWLTIYVMLIGLYERKLASKKVSFSLLWLLALVIAFGVLFLGIRLLFQP